MTASAGAQYRPLGSFRFALALLVVLQHFQHLLPLTQRAIFSHMGFGAIAVCVFFAVSGFVVAEACSVFYASRPGVFLLNRALRLVPPYAAALLLSATVHGALFHAGRLVLWDYDLHTSPLAPARLLTGVLGLAPGFNPRWFGADFEFIPFVWTLRLEIAFYLAAACTIAAGRKFGARRAVACAIAAALGASAVFLVSGHWGALGTAPMFLAGTCLYAWDVRRDKARFVLLLLCIGLALLGFCSWRQRGAPVLAWQLPVLCLLLAMFARLVTQRAEGQARLADRRLGDLSYPIYLNHYVVGILATSLVPWRGICVYVAALCVALLLSALMERLVDRHLRTLRDRVRTVSV